MRASTGTSVAELLFELEPAFISASALPVVEKDRRMCSSRVAVR